MKWRNTQLINSEEIDHIRLEWCPVDRPNSPPGLAISSVLSKFDLHNVLHTQGASHVNKVFVRGPLMREVKEYKGEKEGEDE